MTTSILRFSALPARVALAGLLLLLSRQANAQNVVVETFSFSGPCISCGKARIDSVLKTQKGVLGCQWNEAENKLAIKYDKDITSLITLQLELSVKGYNAGDFQHTPNMGMSSCCTGTRLMVTKTPPPANTKTTPPVNKPPVNPNPPVKEDTGEEEEDDLFDDGMFDEEIEEDLIEDDDTDLDEILEDEDSMDDELLDEDEEEEKPQPVAPPKPKF